MLSSASQLESPWHFVSAKVTGAEMPTKSQVKCTRWSVVATSAAAAINAAAKVQVVAENMMELTFQPTTKK